MPRTNLFTRAEVQEAERYGLDVQCSNLDCMTRRELDRFAHDWAQHPAMRLYATMRRYAMTFRERGLLAISTFYEMQSAWVYDNEIPRKCKW